MAKAGDIALFLNDGSLLGEIISDVTDSPYTHTACFITEDTLVEAWWDGVKVTFLPYRGGAYDVYSPIIPFTEEQIQKGIEFLKSKVGVGYDFTALGGILIEKVTGIKNNPLAHRNREICSELTSQWYCTMGADPVPTKEDASTEPGDFARWGYLIKTAEVR